MPQESHIGYGFCSHIHNKKDDLGAISANRAKLCRADLESGASHICTTLWCILRPGVNRYSIRSGSE